MFKSFVPLKTASLKPFTTGSGDRKLIAFQCCLAFVFLFVAGRLLCSGAMAGQAVRATQCSGAEYRQFDFWVGDWDVYNTGQPQKVVARNYVTSILDGCVLLEDYQQTDGLHGQSFSMYDATRKIWNQTWVTNKGNLLSIDGSFVKGEMILIGHDKTAHGTERTVRGVWRPVSGGVREIATTSIDGGKSWQPWFDIIFRPHRTLSTIR